MVAVNESIVARLKKSGETFEVAVDCLKALEFREGKLEDVREALAVQKIFSDASKGKEASEHLMLQIFSTSNPLQVAGEIIKKGQIQLTSEYRRELKEQKGKKIMDIIHRNGVDPRTHAPHPIARIQNAFEEAKISIDEFEDVNRQVKTILDRLKPILPIKFEIKEIDVIVPPSYAPKCLYTINHFGRKLKDDWLPNGSLHAVIEISGGMEADFYDELNKVCHGKADCKVLKIR